MIPNTPTYPWVSSHHQPTHQPNRHHYQDPYPMDLPSDMPNHSDHHLPPLHHHYNIRRPNPHPRHRPSNLPHRPQPPATITPKGKGWWRAHLSPQTPTPMGAHSALGPHTTPRLLHNHNHNPSNVLISPPCRCRPDPIPLHRYKAHPVAPQAGMWPWCDLAVWRV
eukprot:comp280411_c0_seq1/m.50279 comp280411_c0_seq1/g.50279  ORF comp280411_c0_seq1/g.50279 comp280411_c0_seq1/m.50279 type:complete len:165 (-) comp280411_c0_seq1:20-514(-)